MGFGLLRCVNIDLFLVKMMYCSGSDVDNGEVHACVGAGDI